MHRSWPALSLIVALVATSGCREQELPATGQAQTTWITRQEFRFGNTLDGVYFTRPYARVDPARDRVLVLDGEEVSAWTRTGDLVFVVGGKGDGPGEFRRPGFLFVHGDGHFTVPDQYGSRMTHFAVSGDLLGAEQGPGGRTSYQGFPLVLVSSQNGVFLGHASIPPDLEVGIPGANPMHEHPVLRVQESEPGHWHPPEPLLWQDVRNRTHNIEFADGSGAYGTQPFGDWDLVAYEPGAVVVVRRNRRPGEVDLVEVNATGDTVWHRRLQFEPRRLTPQVIEPSAEGKIQALSQMPDISVLEARAAYYESLYQPEYIPAVEGKPVLTASGEVWLASTETADTSSVYYVVGRGTTNEPVRRVLLPEGLFVTDATTTHVWGFLRDETDVPYIVGRRLVEWSAAARSPGRG